MELAIQDLACRRGGRLIFSGVSARIPAGTVTVVRGPNGSGKSTLLRVLAGFLPPSAGTVDLADISLQERSAWQEQIAYAGHLDAVKPALTVTQNLALWSHLFGRTKIPEAIDRFGLSRIADRPAAQCSAGQKRRLGLARLMVMDRPLWMLDEPTVSLDAASTAEVAALVRDHVAAGGLALIATHIDLGLDDTPILEMAYPGHEAADAAQEDAFLSGEWQ